MLSELEMALGHQSNYLKTTMEHIYPYHPDQHWDDYFGEGINDMQDRSGNVILLEKDELKCLSFIEKKDFYVTTPFVLANKIVEYADWNLQNLNDYQKWLSEQAIITWKADIT